MFKTIKWNTGSAARRFRLKNKKIKLKKLVRKLNKENAPPDGWKPEDKVASARYPKGINWFKKKFDRDLKSSSSQAGGPAHKESGSKPSSGMIFKTILEFEKDK